MSNLFELTDKIKKVTENTTYASNIAYLPSGFHELKPVIHALALKKPKWKLEILDNNQKHCYEVKFEDEITISVNKKYWNEFLKNVLGTDHVEIPAFEADLSGHVMEAKKDDMATLFKTLEQSLYDLAADVPIVTADGDLVRWVITFGEKQYKTPVGVAIPLEHYYGPQSGIHRLLKTLKIGYADDKGGLEILIDAIKKKRPLNAFDGFSDYDNLAGSVAVSVYEGLELSFEVNVSMTFDISENIRVSDEEAIDDLEDSKIVKVVKGGLIFPVGKTFKPGFFKTLKDTIDDFVETKKEEETEK